MARLIRAGMLAGLACWMLFPMTGVSAGGIEEVRIEAARQSLAGRWQATIGRERVVLKLNADGGYVLGDQVGAWRLHQLLLLLEPAEPGEAVEAVAYRYELQENFLTLSEGDLAQPVRFVRTVESIGLVSGYLAWVRGFSWRAAEERLFRILSICVIVSASVLLLALLRGVSSFLIFNNWGPLRFVFRRTPSRTRTVHSVVLNLFKYIIYFTALGQILNELGINYTTYIASLSVIGLAVGFGSQGLVQDVVTGFFLLFEGQISVGDMVEISGQTGIVEEMGLRTTRIRNYIGQSVVVPNRNIALVGNYTKGCLEAYVDIAVDGSRPTSELRKRLSLMAAEFFRQFEGTILSEPRNLGTLRLQTGEAFIRLCFRLWPHQQAFFETQLVPRIREFLAREGAEHPGARVTLFYRHPEPQPTSSWRFRLRRGKAAAPATPAAGTAQQPAASPPRPAP